MGALVRTRVGRWLLLVGVVVAALAVVHPDFGSLGAGSPAPGRDHRPPTTARFHGETITLSVSWKAGSKPKEIGWAIGEIGHPVDMAMVPDVPPRFDQVLSYDPSKRYDIWAGGKAPLSCVIRIDGAQVDHDPDGPLPDAGTDTAVHCWVNPA